MTRSEFNGMPLVPGVAAGFVVVQKFHDTEVPGLKEPDGAEVTREGQVAFWKQAQERVLGFLDGLKSKTLAEAGAQSAAIFDAQQMMLTDPVLEAEIMRGINEGMSARDAVIRTTESLIARFKALDNDYMRERAADIHDLKLRLLQAIDGAARGRNCDDGSSAKGGTIIVAEDLTPSDVALLDKDALLGIVMERGSLTSHASILAKALGRPAVIGVEGICEAVQSGSVVIVDGDDGKVIVNPNPDEIDRCERASGKSDQNVRRIACTDGGGLFVKTSDGKRRVELALNIGGPDDLGAAQRLNIPGINVGLCRTEFIFLDRASMPTEEEQTGAYVDIIRSLMPGEVTFRVLDVGGDKSIPALRLPIEPNPFLGVRGIRLLLNRPEILKTQIRAILRAAAAAGTTVRVMFPMVAVVDEWVQAMEIVSTVQDELCRGGNSVDWSAIAKWGMMVEVPATALSIEEFAPTADFFSIGTNDLIQYTMAADRNSPTVAYLYRPMNKGVTRLIRQTVQGAHAHGKPVSVCGEMAASIEALPLLIEVGVDELSMAAALVPSVARAVSEA
jgi:phosphotransferase system enzyme I (PtsI)